MCAMLGPMTQVCFAILILLQSKSLLDSALGCGSFEMFLLEASTQRCQYPLM